MFEIIEEPKMENNQEKHGSLIKFTYTVCDDSPEEILAILIDKDYINSGVKKDETYYVVSIDSHVEIWELRAQTLLNLETSDARCIKNFQYVNDGAIIKYTKPKKEETENA